MTDEEPKDVILQIKICLDDEEANAWLKEWQKKPGFRVKSMRVVPHTARVPVEGVKIHLPKTFFPVEIIYYILKATRKAKKK